MAEICKYNEKRDIKRVVSGLAVNINDVLRTGVVRDNTDVIDYNNIDNPENIVGRVESPFDAIEAQRAIKKYGKATKESTIKKEVTTPPSTPGSES